MPIPPEVRGPAVEESLLHPGDKSLLAQLVSRGTNCSVDAMHAAPFHRSHGGALFEHDNLNIL